MKLSPVQVNNSYNLCATRVNALYTARIVMRISFSVALDDSGQAPVSLGRSIDYREVSSFVFPPALRETLSRRSRDLLRVEIVRPYSYTAPPGEQQMSVTLRHCFRILMCLCDDVCAHAYGAFVFSEKWVDGLPDHYMPSQPYQIRSAEP